MPYVPTTQAGSATAAAHALATQAENYRRAIAAGVPHDVGEARSILSAARTLVDILEGVDNPHQSPVTRRAGSGGSL